MTRTTRYPICITGILLVCLFAIGTASAYDPDAACASLKEVVTGSGDLTALELVYDYSDGSIGCMKLWTESVINPEETLCASLERALGEERKANSITRVILTLVTGEKRVSYELSPEKSVFVKLTEAEKFPDLSALTKEFGNTLADAKAGFKLDYGPYNSADYSKNGNSVTYWADSITNPATTLPLMTAETWILKKSGFRWVDSCYTGTTQWYVPHVYKSDGPVTLPAGTYKQTAHFEGYKADYNWYEEDQENPNQFTI
ncbi:MAG: hypothetical protein QHH04_03040 [Methanolinea sp.]|jgi:hypothetical protein|nr:hypothetical protein [Methanolinea sp.]